MRPSRPATQHGEARHDLIAVESRLCGERRRNERGKVREGGRRGNGVVQWASLPLSLPLLWRQSFWLGSVGPNPLGVDWSEGAAALMSPPSLPLKQPQVAVFRLEVGIQSVRPPVSRPDDAQREGSPFFTIFAFSHWIFIARIKGAAMTCQFQTALCYHGRACCW